MVFPIFGLIWVSPFESLQAILTKANPPIRDESTPSGTVFQDRVGEPMSCLELSNWTEFNLETLIDAYGDILNEQVRVTNHAPAEMPSIRSFADLKTVAQRHIFPTLQDTMQAGARQIGIRLGRHLPTPEFHPSLSFQGPCAAFTLLSGNGDALLVGCVQHAKQWNSSDLLVSDSAKYPISLLVRDCRVAGTRYGFVLTSNEIVVVRVSRADTRRAFHVEWQAIPWGATGNSALTVNLALWFLAMMSLNDDHRQICDSTELLPLNSWSRSVGSDGQIVYQHHLSMRKRFDLPVIAAYTEV
ncbi:hypothetical protein LCI18_006894 [Fusarium solani-melongenae]|uniref:Uncharacterized protein n=1 Tax=Fusarium solani subsp. cucurbitae TaxID=2747967 RepID=A0ACD3Z3W7_FUSSC|nr:hypothetical protein LCI18_006894 [Fusarium solani-melongenae]